MTRFAAILTVALSALFCAAFAAMGEQSADARSFHARAVALTDAKRAPDWIAIAGPGEIVMPPTVHNRYGAPCIDRHGRAHFFSDVSAYRGTGRALPAQTWSDFAYHWGHVSYDGVAFHNHYWHRTVLVAGWCERGTVPTR